MSDAITIAESYIALWNERDPTRRRAHLAEGWTADAAYADPMMGAEGHEEIDGLIQAVQERFPNFRFTLTGQPDGHGPHLRFSWMLGPEGADGPIKGTDFATLEGGRLKTVTGFLDQVPA